MKEHGIKILYGILAVGIIIAIFHILNDQNGLGLVNVISTLTITSIILFLSTTAFILLDFRKNIRRLNVWLLLILSFPLTIISVANLTKEFSLQIAETTTPKEFIYNVKVDPEIFERDKIKIQKLVDSLIKVKTVEKPTKLALKYFNGKTYNDTIERDWAIDLPQKVEYKQSIIDTLFYSENGNQVLAGLLINKVFNKSQDYPNGRTEYFGKGFEFYQNELQPIKMLKYSVTGYDSYKSCSERLRYYYLKKIGTYENELNMNDTRFLNRK